MSRAATGIKVLDKVLEGGLPRPSSVLITGDIGTNKNTLAQQILFYGLKRGEKAIYITVDSFPEDLICNMKKYGWDVEPFLEEERLVFIDGFSPRVGVDSKAHYIVENPFNLDELLTKIVLAEAEFFEENVPCRVVVSHVSTVLFMARRREVLRFFERMHAEARKYNGVYMFVYTEGVKHPSVETFMKQLTDVVLELSRDPEGRRSLRVSRCVKTRYPRNTFPYTLSENGIVISDVEEYVY